MTFTNDPSVRDQRLNDLLRAIHPRYVDLALLIVSAVLIAFAIGYVVGVRTAMKERPKSASTWRVQ